MTVANVIQAHKSPISFLSIDSTGTLLATSSDKGTVIRVWSIPGAEKLYQFRRGTRETKIYLMNFNVVGTLLAVSSAHDTVHIFRLGSRGKGGSGGSGTGNGSGSGSISASSSGSDKSPSGGLSGAVSPPESVDSQQGVQDLDAGYDVFVEKKKSNSVSYVFYRHLPKYFVETIHRSSLRRKSVQMTKTLSHSVGGYLPNTLTEMWEPTRDFAFLKLPASGARTIVALSG